MSDVLFGSIEELLVWSVISKSNEETLYAYGTTTGPVIPPESVPCCEALPVTAYEDVGMNGLNKHLKLPRFRRLIEEMFGLEFKIVPLPEKRTHARTP